MDFDKLKEFKKEIKLTNNGEVVFRATCNLWRNGKIKRCFLDNIYLYTIFTNKTKQKWHQTVIRISHYKKYSYFISILNADDVWAHLLWFTGRPQSTY